MDNLVRLFVMVFLAVFAAGSVAHASNLTSMSFGMSPAAMTDGEMGDCDGCPPADNCKAKPCVLFCFTPLVAVPTAAEFELPLVLGVDVATLPAEEIAGQTGPPDVPPPRAIVL